MTLDDLYKKGLINDETMIYIKRKDRPFGSFECGHWNENNVATHLKDKVSEFEWMRDDNELYVILEKQGGNNGKTKVD